MNTEKFTPGEWKRDIYTNSVYITVDKQYKSIAHVNCINRSDSEWSANSALISAAPEMYRKLNTVLALCEGGLLRKTRCDILGKEIEELLKKARGEE